MLSWTFRPDSWSFDVSSLIVLIGEREELSYRLSQRSLLACVSAAPVIGLQSYIRSYDLLLETGSRSYFTPYGCNTAPLRNMRLQSAMDVSKLLADGRYTVYAIPPAPSDPSARGRRRYPIYTILLSLWVALTWLVVGLMTAEFLAGSYATTWIGFVNCLVLSAWSVVLRVLEHFLIRPAPRTATSNPAGWDAVFILGRRQSAFVLEGSRQDVKDWTGRGLVYARESTSPVPAALCQACTRLVTFLVLALVFTTVPNGSTADRVAFVLLNGLGQLNVLIGRRLGSWACLDNLQRQPESRRSVAGRTEIYGLLLRKFRHVGRGDGAWVDVSAMLPRTDAWEEWKQRILAGDTDSPRQIYQDVYRRLNGHWRPVESPGSPDAGSCSDAESK